MTHEEDEDEEVCAGCGEVHEPIPEINDEFFDEVLRLWEADRPPDRNLEEYREVYAKGTEKMRQLGRHSEAHDFAMGCVIVYAMQMSKVLEQRKRRIEQFLAHVPTEGPPN